MIDLAETYEALPYEGEPVPASHPDNLAVRAFLLGMRPARADSCRVLELGCGTGGNLIPLAVALPASHFVGIDLVPAQIRAGLDIVQRLDLHNIQLHAANILDLDSSFGTFDYLLCHGVYSWVPQAIRDRLLALCRSCLAPHGIAFISYNTYPGWHLRAATREILRYHARHFGDPNTQMRESRALMDLLANSFRNSPQVFGQQIQEDMRDLAKLSDSYVYHEFLEPDNQPVLFRQFIDHAAAHALQYVEEAEFAPLPHHLPPELRKTWLEMPLDLLEHEQYLDFLRGRMFRRTLLTHRDVTLVRPASLERVTTLRIAAAVWPTSAPESLEQPSPLEFRSPRGRTLTTSNPLVKSMLVRLAEAWPDSLDFNSLWEQLASLAQTANLGKRDLAQMILEFYHLSTVDLYSISRNLAPQAGERPRASPLARLQAENGSRVTSLNHRRVELDDFERFVLQHVDGDRTRADILANLVALAQQGAFTVHVDDRPTQDPAALFRALEQSLQASLDKFAKHCLLYA